MIQRLNNQGFRFYQGMFSEKTHFGELVKQAHNFRSRHYFRNPNGPNLDLCDGNLLLKFKGDPTVNEPGIEILLKYVE